MGKKWKTLSEEERAPYRAEAEKLRLLHQMEYPDYKYRPKKRQKSGGQLPASTGSPDLNMMVKQEVEEEYDTPVKRRLIQNSESSSFSSSSSSSSSYPYFHYCFSYLDSDYNQNFYKLSS